MSECPRRTIFSSKGVGEPPLNHGISVRLAEREREREEERERERE